MKGLAILNAHKIYPSSKHFYERMRDEFAKYGVELSYAQNDEILACVNSESTISCKVKDNDFILYIDKDPYVLAMLDKLGVRVFDKEESIRLCDDKMLTYITLSGNGIRMPKSIAGPLNYSNEVSETFITNLTAVLSLPLVAKLNFGSMGSNVYLINTVDELRNFEQVHRFDPRLYQEFISASRGKDYRLIVINGKFVAGMMRKNDNDFRSNIGAGGMGISVEIPANYIEIAEKAAKILKLDYCGVDILDDNGSPVLCEVNSNAFLAGIEKTTGINVAKAYVEHILKELSYL